MDRRDLLDLAHKQYSESSRFADAAYTRYAFATPLLLVVSGANYAILKANVNFSDGMRASEILTLGSSLLGFVCVIAAAFHVAKSVYPKTHEEIGGIGELEKWRREIQQDRDPDENAETSSWQDLEIAIIDKFTSAEKVNLVATSRRRDSFHASLKFIYAAMILLMMQAGSSLPQHLWRAETNEREAESTSE